MAAMGIPKIMITAAKPTMLSDMEALLDSAIVSAVELSYAGTGKEVPIFCGEKI
jgi:hypothetical protein